MHRGPCAAALACIAASLACIAGGACVQPRDDISQSEIAILEANTGDVICSVAEAPACRAFDMGDAPVGALVTVDVLLVNPSDQDLHIAKLETTGANELEILSGAAPAVVPAGAVSLVDALRVTLAVAAESEGNFDGDFVVTSDARNADGALALPLIARGTASFAGCLRVPQELDFGAATVGETLARELVFENLCHAPFELIDASIAGDAQGHFTSASGLVFPTTIAGESSLTWPLEAAPELGAWSATLDFTAQQETGILSASVVLRAAGL